MGEAGRRDFGSWPAWFAPHVTPERISVATAPPTLAPVLSRVARRTPASGLPSSTSWASRSPTRPPCAFRPPPAASRPGCRRGVAVHRRAGIRLPDDRTGLEVGRRAQADRAGNRMANAELWAAGIDVPAYAIDDQTAIKVTDDLREEFGVCIGSGIGGLTYLGEQHRRIDHSTSQHPDSHGRRIRRGSLKESAIQVVGIPAPRRKAFRCCHTDHRNDKFSVSELWSHF